MIRDDDVRSAVRVYTGHLYRRPARKGTVKRYITVRDARVKHDRLSRSPYIGEIKYLFQRSKIPFYADRKNDGEESVVKIARYQGREKEGLHGGRRRKFSESRSPSPAPFRRRGTRL